MEEVIQFFVSLISIQTIGIIFLVVQLCIISREFQLVVL